MMRKALFFRSLSRGFSILATRANPEVIVLTLANP